MEELYGTQTHCGQNVYFLVLNLVMYILTTKH